MQSKYIQGGSYHPGFVSNMVQTWRVSLLKIFMDPNHRHQIFHIKYLHNMMKKVGVNMHLTSTTNIHHPATYSLKKQQPTLFIDLPIQRILFKSRVANHRGPMMHIINHRCSCLIHHSTITITSHPPLPSTTHHTPSGHSCIKLLIRVRLASDPIITFLLLSMLKLSDR